MGGARKSSYLQAFDNFIVSNFIRDLFNSGRIEDDFAIGRRLWLGRWKIHPGVAGYKVSFFSTVLYRPLSVKKQKFSRTEGLSKPPFFLPPPISKDRFKRRPHGFPCPPPGPWDSCIPQPPPLHLLLSWGGCCEPSMISRAASPFHNEILTQSSPINKDICVRKGFGGRERIKGVES